MHPNALVADPGASDLSGTAQGTYWVCSSGCGVLAPMLVGDEARCLGCGAPAERMTSERVIERLLDRASPLFSDAERNAMRRLAVQPARSGVRAASEDPALAAAREKLEAALDLRDFLLRPATERYGELPRD